MFYFKSRKEILALLSKNIFLISVEILIELRNETIVHT